MQKWVNLLTLSTTLNVFHNRFVWIHSGQIACMRRQEASKHTDASTYIFLDVFGLDSFVRVVRRVQSPEHQPAERDMTHISTRSQTNDSEIHLSTNLLSQPMFCPYCASLSHSQFFVWATQTLHNSYAVKQNHIPLTCFRDSLLINIEVTSVIMNVMFSLPHCEDHWETGQF